MSRPKDSPTNYPATLTQAACALKGEAPFPQPDVVVAALLAAEKACKQSHERFSYEQLLGTWRLGFVTGTSRTRTVAGQVIGAGRFLPGWVRAEITYLPPEGWVSKLPAREASGDSNRTCRGQIGNSVTLGPLRLALAGPAQLWQQQNLLSFDFTRLALEMGNWSPYQGYRWRGQRQEAEFYQQPLKQQAFFNYFWVQPEAIAARGRGGGLALWTRKTE